MSQHSRGGAAFGESKAIKGYKRCQRHAKMRAPGKGLGTTSYFAVNCFSLFVGMWIIFIGSNGGKRVFLSFPLIAVLPIVEL